MASYRSTNPLGRFFSPGPGSAVIKVDVPANVTDFDGNPLAAPIDDGGVFCCDTTDLNLAVNRNWRNLTSLGTMGLALEFSVDAVFASSSDFTPLGGSVGFEAGETGLPSSVIGEDMTMSSQRFDRDTVIVPRVQIGNATQIDLSDPDPDTQVHPSVPVYIQPTLDWAFYAYRFWSNDGSSQSLVVPAALMLQFAIVNEENYGWDEDAFPVGGDSMFSTTNWKVATVDEMSQWNLPTDFPGLNAAGLALNLTDENVISFEFGDEDTHPNVPINSYNATAGQSSITIVEARWIFPTIADPLPAL